MKSFSHLVEILPIIAQFILALLVIAYVTPFTFQVLSAPVIGFICSIQLRRRLNF